MSPGIKHNLRWFWWSGVFGHASESIVATYLTLYLLALGATSGQIGMLSALANLSAALMAVPGAIIVERWGRRKQICVLPGGGGARSVLVLLALIPLAFVGPTAVYVAILLALVRAALANLAVPAWTSLVADVVPGEWRGRYFSSRNVAMGVAGMVVIYLVGALITRVGGSGGYQLALGLAFGLGMVSTIAFARMTEPGTAIKPRVGSSPRLPLLQNVRRNSDFLALCAVAALWNFALNVAGPFFSVFFATDLKGSAGFWGIIAAAHGAAALPGQRLFGTLSDRWGPRRVQLVTGLLIPFVSWLWALSRAPWHLIPIELLSGFLWAGYNLASFSYLLAITPQDRRARYAALYHIVVTLALAAGAATGGLIVTHWGNRIVLALSGLGRMAAALLFVRFVRQRRTGAE